MTMPLPEDQTEPSAPSTNAPPGWYPDPTGRIVWWDGSRWTVPLPERESDRTWAVLSHLSALAVSVIGPILIRVLAGKDDPFVKHHATEALNAQITFMLGWIVAFFSTVILTAADIAAQSSTSVAPPWSFLVLFGIALVLMGALIGMSIRGAVMAHRGIWWRYPVSIRFVPGAAKR